MTNYFDLFSDVLKEKGLTISDLTENNVVKQNVFYEFSKYCPSLSNGINFANFVEVSLDYVFEITNENNFKRYKTSQTNFYNKLSTVLEQMNVKRIQLSKNLGISRSTFLRWQYGAQPKLSTVVEIAKLVGCHIDDLLETEK